MLHLRCWARWLQYEAIDQQERARIARDRSISLVATARRLFDQLSEDLRRRAQDGERPFMTRR